MDGDLPPFMRRNPIWPSTFPKVLAVLGALVAGDPPVRLEKATGKENLRPTSITAACRITRSARRSMLLIALMVAYALTLRPLGFPGAPRRLPLVLGGGPSWASARLHILIPVAAFATGSIWYLVQEVLGIFLRPLPGFM
jgi:putative tricarboxylic transport membrane protein